MNNLLISGISGKVGFYTYNLAKNFGFNVIGGVDKNIFVDASVPIYKYFSDVKEHVDFIIDFSSDALTNQAIDFAQKNNCKLICGTTGLLKSTYEKIKILSSTTAVCISVNFSEAFKIYSKLIPLIKNNLPEFDCSITEIHNAEKKDLPSGTAKKLAFDNNIKNVFSIRGGNIAGLHKTLFLGNGEEIEITHRAYDKSIFAIGALKCALALKEKKNGLFNSYDFI